HNAELAKNAVVIVSEATDAARGSGDAMKRSREEAARIAEGFQPLVRDVIRVPYDPALVNGVIRYDALRPETQRAWLAAAAAVAKCFLDYGTVISNVRRATRIRCTFVCRGGTDIGVPGQSR